MSVNKLRELYNSFKAVSVNKASFTSKGFTLMELLIVIIILGFLIGMIAPRLASIIDDTVVDTVCDTNNKGARQYVKLYFDKTGKLPNNVISLVNETTAGNYVLPSVEDGDPDNGAETFAETFDKRNDLRVHILNQDEADALRGLGISHVRILNDRSNGNTVLATARPFQKIEVQEGTPVTMIGMGAAAAATANLLDSATVADWDGTTVVDYPVGNPYWVGRIILGLGVHSTLVTAGYVQNSALCPGGIQNEANVAYNNYNLVVPRLGATVARCTANMLNAEFTIVDAENTTGGALETFLFEEQPNWAFDAVCPEGHMWPDNDNETWVVQ